MSRFIKRTISYFIRKTLDSKFIKSIIGENDFSKAYKVFGHFSDSRGNTYELLSGLRDALKPNWWLLLEPRNNFQLPSRRTIRGVARSATSSVEELSSLLRAFSFDIMGKRILEIGCSQGAATYALAQRGASTVVGSDLASYSVLQQIDGHLSEESLLEQNQHFETLREIYRKAMCPVSSKAESVRFIEDDICSSSLPSTSFDLVCSWEVLEHVQDPKAMFEHIYRILRPGGISFHEYNPFFSLNGGHSLCTLDFHWGHARIDFNDFLRYVKQIRHEEARLAQQFYEHNLNRMTLFELEQYCKQASFEILTLIKWTEKKHLHLVNKSVLTQVAKVCPHAGLLDVASPKVWIVVRKPA